MQSSLLILKSLTIKVHLQSKPEKFEMPNLVLWGIFVFLNDSQSILCLGTSQQINPFWHWYEYQHWKENQNWHWIIDFCCTLPLKQSIPLIVDYLLWCWVADLLRKIHDPLIKENCCMISLTFISQPNFCTSVIFKKRMFVFRIPHCESVRERKMNIRFWNLQWRITEAEKLGCKMNIKPIFPAVNILVTSPVAADSITLLSSSVILCGLIDWRVVIFVQLH